MKRSYILLGALSAALVITNAQAHWQVNFGFSSPRPIYPRPHRVIYQPAYPVYYEPYYPVYQPVPVVQYVERRDPKLAMMQDGFNLMFDAMAYSSEKRARRHHRNRYHWN